MTAQYSGVMVAMSDYFDGLYFSDTARLERVFHPRAHYICATDGYLTNLTMDEYLPVVQRRPSPASRGEPRADKIVSIQFAGPVTAFVHAECTIGLKRFIDFLTFIQLNGEWRIISKVFHFDVQSGT